MLEVFAHHIFSNLNGDILDVLHEALHNIVKAIEFKKSAKCNEERLLPSLNAWCLLIENTKCVYLSSISV